MHHRCSTRMKDPVPVLVTWCTRPARYQGALIPALVSYLPHRAVRNICFLHVLGDHRGVAGADEHRGADIHRLAPRGRMNHPVESVQGCCDGELAGPLPPGPRAPSQRGRVGCFASGG